jgi:hypothetical protein
METGWEKLKDRREKHKLVQFYKMTKNLTPHYISFLVPQAFANIHDYNTRNASALPVVRTRTSLYYCGINVGLKRNTAFVIWNGEFAQGDYQYNNKIVLKIYLILENTSRLEWMDFL